jgi:hypothetical protein
MKNERLSPCCRGRTRPALRLILLFRTGWKKLWLVFHFDSQGTLSEFLGLGGSYNRLRNSQTSMESASHAAVAILNTSQAG